MSKPLPMSRGHRSLSWCCATEALLTCHNPSSICSDTLDGAWTSPKGADESANTVCYSTKWIEFATWRGRVSNLPIKRLPFFSHFLAGGSAHFFLFRATLLHVAKKESSPAGWEIVLTGNFLLILWMRALCTARFQRASAYSALI